MLYFLFFILGIIFIQFIIPVLDALFSIIYVKIEVIKGKYVLQTTEINKQIADIVGDEDGSPQPVIGFQYSEAEEDFDDL